MNKPSAAWTRDRLTRIVGWIFFGMVVGAYLYGVVRSLFAGGSLPSALWLPDPARREMFLGWAATALVAALVALAITRLSLPKTSRADR